MLARATIARQEEELGRLRAELANQRFAADLSDALKVASIAGLLGSPGAPARAHRRDRRPRHRRRRRIAAAALTQSPTADLRGRGRRRGGGEGLVVTSGQPLAIPDTSADARVAQDVTRAPRLLPRKILCVPLGYDEQPIGVLELLDRRGANAFGPADIETLTLFAKQAAIAIKLSRTYRSFTMMVGELVESLGPEGDPAGALQDRVSAFSAPARLIPSTSGAAFSVFTRHWTSPGRLPCAERRSS